MMTYDLSDLLLCLKEILKIIRNSPHETDSAEVPCTGSFLVPSLQSSTLHGSETETDATRATFGSTSDEPNPNPYLPRFVCAPAARMAPRLTVALGGARA